MRPLLIAALLIGMAGAAHAQAPAQQPPDPDLNHDGKVTLAELQQMEAKGFMSRVDANHDGNITRAEFKALVDFARQKGGEPGAKRAAGLFIMLDTDKDGVVTMAERHAATARRFSMVDTNHDGWLSKTEVLAMRQIRQREN